MLKDPLPPSQANGLLFSTDVSDCSRTKVLLLRHSSALTQPQKRADTSAEIEELTQQLRALKEQLADAERCLAEAEETRHAKQQSVKAAQRSFDQAERHFLTAPIGSGCPVKTPMNNTRC